MTNKILFRFLIVFVLLFSFSFTSCNNDEGNGGSYEIVSYLTGKYSPNNDSKKLMLTLNDVSITDKEVYLNTDTKTATFTLYKVIAGEDETVIPNVALTSDAEKTMLSFAGTHGNITYSGNISNGILTLYLKVK